MKIYILTYKITEFGLNDETTMYYSNEQIAYMFEQISCLIESQSTFKLETLEE